MSEQKREFSTISTTKVSAEKIRHIDEVQTIESHTEPIEDVKRAIQTALKSGKNFPELAGEQFHGLNSNHLESARNWCYQINPENYTAEAILELYQFIQESWGDGLSLGPTAFRYCRTIEEIKAQHARTKEILGGNLEAFVKGEKIYLEKIGDYEIKIHEYGSDFGSGLICLSMHRQDREVARSSFYPANPLKVYEIKGIAPSKQNQTFDMI